MANKAKKSKAKTKTVKSVKHKEKKGKSSVKKDKKVVKKVSKVAKVKKKAKAVKPAKVAKVKKVEVPVVPVAPPVKMQKLGKRKKIVHYSPPEITFMNLAMKGTATIADLDTHIDMWHDSPTSTNLLHEYLGMSAKEFKYIISNMANGLVEMLEKRGKKAARAEAKSTNK